MYNHNGLRTNFLIVFTAAFQCITTFHLHVWAGMIIPILWKRKVIPNGLSYRQGLISDRTRGTNPNFNSVQPSSNYRKCCPSTIKYLRKKLHPPLDSVLRWILPFSLLGLKQKWIAKFALKTKKYFLSYYLLYRYLQI